MSNYRDEIADNIENYLIGLDDTFAFKCRGCGKCCKNRDDILLTTRDICNIAKKLNMTTSDAISKYCESYLGDNSRIPILRLKPQGKNKVCPLLNDDRCLVHDMKPAVCALFPLGRVVLNESHEANSLSTDSTDIKYIITPLSCGSVKRKQTVRRWLERYVAMKIVNGEVIVIVGIGYAKTSLHAKWNDDARINEIAHELIYGRFKNEGVNTVSDRIKVIKETYKPGTRVLLISMSGEPQMPEGLEGVVTLIDDIGQLQCSWSNGSSLALNIKEDVFVTYSTTDEAKEFRDKLGLRNPGTDKSVTISMQNDSKTEYTSDESREGHCPRCGNELQNYGSFNVFDYPWECSSCGAAGREHGIVYFDGHYVDLPSDSEEK